MQMITPVPPRTEVSTAASFDVRAAATAQPEFFPSQGPEDYREGSVPAEAEGTAPGTGGSSGGGKSRGGRDLKAYPVFSARFPWRRLRMAPVNVPRAPLAGIRVWPEPEGVSPLQLLLRDPRP